MGEIADAMIEGDMCSMCGEWVGDGWGFPGVFAGCAKYDECDPPRPILGRSEPVESDRQYRKSLAKARKKARNNGGWLSTSPNLPKPWLCSCGKPFHTAKARRQHAEAKGCELTPPPDPCDSFEDDGLSS